MSQFSKNDKSFMRNSDNKLMYDEVLKEYLTLGHMKETKDLGPGYYLSHHGIFKPESTTTKLRVVFNATSFSTEGRSLNDILHVGPALQIDIVSFIMK